MSAILGLVLMATSASVAPEVIPLWPNGAPGSESRRNEPETRPHPWSIANVQNPSITVYLPARNKAIGTAVLIAPGGGHIQLVIDEEGCKPAEFLNRLGVTAFVLRYRLAGEPGSTLKVERDTRADAYRAMRLVRSRAKEWGIRSDRIGMMGFSAGGEVLSMAAFGPGKGDPTASDAVDREDERPNFGIWIYPGPYGIPNPIPSGAPPAFILVANDDRLSAVALDLTHRLRNAKVPVELHVLQSGGHGFNMGDRSTLESVKTWPKRLADWLKDSGYLKP